MRPVESAAPVAGGGGSFGWGITSADLTGDGKMDLLVAEAQGDTPGRVFAYDGLTGRHLGTIEPPELNANGASPTLAFVYVEHMPDIGGCPSGEGGDPDEICDDARVGGLDGIPEVIVGSRALRVGPDGEAGRTADPAIGRGYVFDGRSLVTQRKGVVLKRIDMPPEHRESQRLRAASPQFGRAMMSPQGLPPCDGPAAEANNAGVGPCAPTDEVPPAVRIGDVDGGANSANPAERAAARADIVVGVRGYRETTTPGRVNSAAPGSQCANLTGAAAIAPDSNSGNCTGGKGFIYRGEDIANSSPREILDGVTDGQNTGVITSERPVPTLTNPFSQTSSGDVFGNLQRLGDVGACPGANATNPTRCATTGDAARTFNPDGKPEIVVTDAFLDYPVNNPDGVTGVDVGGAYVYDGDTGRFRDFYEHPEPENRSVFTHNFNSGFPTGNLGHSTLPDFLSGAPAQSVHEVADGRVYVWNGEATSGRGRLIGAIDDPTPKPAGNFGSSYTGVGDVVPGQQNPANEVMIGSYSPFITSTEASANLIGDVHIVNATMNRVIQTIPDPVQEPGSGFGVGITPMGDLNADGFLDFAVSSYLSNLAGQPAEGRAYIFRSNNSPATPPPRTPAATVSTPKLLRPGRCSNDTLGTARADALKGTIAGDRMLGFGGDDRVEGLEEDDCLDGGSGADRLLGATGVDRVLGGSGNDRVLGGNDRDRLFGMSGRDRLKGGYGPDLIAGGRGNDSLDGGPHTDRIYGEQGRDRIRSGGGRNFLDGGTGGDLIYARNDRRDVISCGSGRDRVQADRTDVVRVDCERISRAKRRAKR